VQVNYNVPFSSEITNSATVDSDGKPAKTASVSFTINKEALSPVIENIQIISGSIIRDDIAGEVVISFEMPNGIGQEDIDIEKPIMLDLGEVQIAADNMKVEENDGKVQITVFFDKFAILDALSGYGQFDVEIIGYLKDGRTFSGQTKLTIEGTELVSDYISKIHFEQTCNYESPTDSNDETCEFYIKISAESDKANNMNADVNSIEVSTPAGHIFQIPKLTDQWSDDTWTSYEYSPDDGGEATWEYMVTFSGMAGLQDYGDGQYTITLHYNNGNQNNTKAWFGMADIDNPLLQPPEPVITYPSPNLIVESPITFSWVPFIDAEVSNISIVLDEKTNGGYRKKDFDINTKSWGPVYLTNGRWEVTMTAENSSYIPENDDGIETESYKISQSRYDFKVINYLTNTYDVWGGDIWINLMDASYGSIADMNEYGYQKLVAEPNKPETYIGNYNYYVIATKGRFLLDSIQGLNSTYYYGIGTNTKENVINEEYLLGKTDGLCATIGNNNPSEDYSGWLAFENPDSWEGITVTTRKLNISKKAVNTPEELENISSGDTITYKISCDTSEMLYDVNNITIIDYLPDEVSYLSADINEISGFYDTNEHTFTWLVSSLSPRSVIELLLTVKVNIGIAPDTIITNFAAIDSTETPATVASASVMVSKNQQREADMQVVPDTISRYGIDVSGVMVILELPPDVTEEQVNENELLVLTLDSDESIITVISNADQDVMTYEGITYVLAVFDKTRLLNSIPGSGKKIIRVEGKLIEGSFVGIGNLTIN
jgi:hypothetical protein